MVSRVSKLAVHIVGGVLAACLVVIAALGLRLAAGPISLSFLNDDLASALSVPEQGLTARLGDTVLTWGGLSGDIALQVVDLEFRDQSRQLVGRVDAAKLALSIPGLVLEGRLQPTGVVLERPRIQLVRRPDGALELGLGGGAPLLSRTGPPPAAGAAEPALPAAGLLFDVLRAGGVAARLNRLAFERAELDVFDQITGRRWTSRDASFEARRFAPGKVAVTHRGAYQSLGETTSLTLRGEVDLASGAEFALEFNNAVPALFDTNSRMTGVLGGVTMPLDGRLELSVDAAGRPLAARLNLIARQGGVSLPGLFPNGVTVDGGRLVGAFDAATGVMTLEQLSVRRGSFALSATGTVTLGAGAASPGLDLTIEVPHLAIDDLPAVWPVGIAVSGRRWIMQNMTGGDLEAGHFAIKAAPGALDQSPPPADALNGRFRIRNTQVRYMAALPPLAGVDADATMDLDNLSLTVSKGLVDLGGDGVVSLEPSTVKVTDFNAKDQFAHITFVAAGPLRAALALLDRPPLRYAAKLGLDPAVLGGSQRTEGHFSFPLIAGLDADALTFAADSTLTGVAVPQAVHGLDLADGAFALHVDNKGAGGTGQARLGPVPVTLAWTESFVAPAGQPTTALTVEGHLDDAMRQTLGIPAADRLRGPLDARLSLTGRGPSITQLDVDVAFAGASLALPELGLDKPAGTPGRFRFTARRAADGLRIDDLTLTAAGLDLAGSARLSATGELLSLTVPRSRVGSNELGLTVNRKAANLPFDIAVTGSRLDLVPYLTAPPAPRRPESERPDPSATDSLPDFRFSVALDRIALDKKTALTGVTARGVHGGGLWLEGKAAAMLGSQPFAVTLTRDRAARHLQASGGEAGAIIRALGLYDDAVGGQIKVDATIDDTKPTRPMEAQVDIRDFRIVNAPVLAQILSLGSLTGFASTVNGAGIGFERLRINLIQETTIMRIVKARAIGDAIGMTMAGTYDTWARTVSLGGTIVPAYGINRIIGAIPLIGKVLTGGEGVFAFTYQVVGPAEKPDVSVNPLSALAPGILRDIVSALDGSADAADAAAPPPP